MATRSEHIGAVGKSARKSRRDPLRVRAEKLLRKTRGDVASLSASDVQQLIHELQVHQVELKMQNEELQATARELEDSRAQYQKLYELAPVGYLELDGDGVIQRSNAAASALFAVPRRLVGKAIAGFVDARDLRTLNEHLRTVRKSGTATSEVRLGGLDPSTHVKFETTGGDAPDSYYRMVLTDISDLKRSERALEKLNQELEERVAARTAELAQRNQELVRESASRIQVEQERRSLEARLREAERLEGLGLLAGGIAHDFNNLLVSVLSNADLMLDDERTSEHAREGLLLIKRAAVGAAELTRQMLIYAGQGRVTLEPLDLEDAVNNALALLRSRLPRDTELSATFRPGMPAIKGDRAQVQQVVTNLVMNSIEAIGNGAGRIAVHAHLEELDAARIALYTHRNDIEPGQYVVLRVNDTGPGMDTATLARVFDPFYTTKFSGRGLGLASVLGIVRGNRAGLCVRSEPGKETSFEIAWPVAAGMASPRAREAAPTGTKWKGSGRVLVIDDTSHVRNAVALQLGQLGFEATEAAGGTEGLDLFRAAAPGFVLAIVDRTMPGLSGEQTIAALHELAPKLPVILMSGYTGRDLVLPNEHATFLQKPMTTDELRDVVRGLLDRPSYTVADVVDARERLTSTSRRAPAVTADTSELETSDRRSVASGAGIRLPARR